MPILTEESFLEIGKLFQKNSKAEVWTHVLLARLNVRTFGVCLHQKWNLNLNLHLKSKAQKINLKKYD